MTATLSTEDIVLRSFAAAGIHHRLAWIDPGAPIRRTLAAAMMITTTGLVANASAYVPNAERVGTPGLAFAFAILGAGMLLAYRIARPGHIVARTSAAAALAYGIFVAMDWHQLKLIQVGPDGWDLWGTGAGTEVMYAHQHPTWMLFGYCLFFAGVTIIVVDSALRLGARQRLRSALATLGDTDQESSY